MSDYSFFKDLCRRHLAKEKRLSIAELQRQLADVQKKLIKAEEDRMESNFKALENYEDALEEIARMKPVFCAVENHYKRIITGRKCYCIFCKIYEQSAPKQCRGKDPLCPCQDGDMCHYEGENPMQTAEEYEQSTTYTKSSVADDCKIEGMITTGKKDEK